MAEDLGSGEFHNQIEKNQAELGSSVSAVYSKLKDRASRAFQDRSDQLIDQLYSGESLSSWAMFYSRVKLDELSGLTQRWINLNTEQKAQDFKKKPLNRLRSWLGRSPDQTAPYQLRRSQGVISRTTKDKMWTYDSLLLSQRSGSDIQPRYFNLEMFPASQSSGSKVELAMVMENRPTSIDITLPPELAQDWLSEVDNPVLAQLMSALPTEGPAKINLSFNQNLILSIGRGGSETTRYVGALNGLNMTKQSQIQNPLPDQLDVDQVIGLTKSILGLVTAA